MTHKYATPTKALRVPDLPTLRLYRNSLLYERDLTRSWARTCTRRADLLAAGVRPESLPSLDTLISAVQAPVVSYRAEIIARYATCTLRKPPALDGRWARLDLPPSRQREALRAAADSLIAREATLAALHQQATEALINVYRKDPSACLDLITV